MDIDKYKALTNKKPIKIKPRTRPLPKAKDAYLEAEENFEHALNIFGIKYEKQFHFKSTKHWRFDFNLIEHRILVEISGGPWSGGRGGKLKNKAWSLDRYDDAEARVDSMLQMKLSLIAQHHRSRLINQNIS